MLILSWHITFTLESVQTDLESVHFCQIFNRFLFTSSSHFPSLTVKESFASKLQVYYLQLLPLWHPIFYKSIFERTAVLFLWSAPNVLGKWKLSANDFFLQFFVRLEALHIVRSKQCCEFRLMQQTSWETSWRYSHGILISLTVLLILILIF